MLEVTYRKISELTKYERNSRTHSAAQIEQIKNSIKEFGFTNPILIDEHGLIIAGHGRLEAAKELSMEAVPTITLHGLSDAQKKAYVIADNKLALNAGWDDAMLESELRILQEVDYDLSLIGFDDAELDVIFDEIVEVLEAEEDDFDATPPEEPITVLGDLYEIGEHRLLCGDSTDSDQVAKLMNGEKVDMVFTSPPYNGNTGADRDNKKNMKGLYLDNETDNKTSDEYIKFNADIFNTIKTIASKDCVILYNINYNRNSPSEYIDVVNEGRNVFNLVETIVWEKQLAISLQGNNLTRIYEFIFVLFNGNDKPNINKGYTECEKNLWKISNIGANNENHSACFPIKLVDKAINLYGKNNAILYEPFTGSGTTMVASHQLKRKCYGMELDPKYCDVIVKRMLKLDDTLTVKRNGVDCTNDFLI